jgi:hypothetical protein
MPRFEPLFRVWRGVHEPVVLHGLTSRVGNRILIPRVPTRSPCGTVVPQKLCFHCCPFLRTRPTGDVSPFHGRFLTCRTSCLTRLKWHYGKVQSLEMISQNRVNVNVIHTAKNRRNRRFFALFLFSFFLLTTYYFLLTSSSTILYSVPFARIVTLTSERPYTKSSLSANLFKVPDKPLHAL